jgi:hypothetical protein
MLVSCLAYSSTPKMEAMCSSETPVDFHRTTRRYIPEHKETALSHFCKFHKINRAGIKYVNCVDTQMRVLSISSEYGFPFREAVSKYELNLYVISEGTLSFLTVL